MFNREKDLLYLQQITNNKRKYEKFPRDKHHVLGCAVIIQNIPKLFVHKRKINKKNGVE